MHLYKTTSGNILQHKGESFLLQDEWNELINHENLHHYLLQLSSDAEKIENNEASGIIATQIMAPLEKQEVWAAGVTYLRSRDARMEESKEAGGAYFYQKVYEADRPELFFKSLPHRVAAHNSLVYIRKDSEWNVPEPELTLYINSNGNIQAYTIGNDMSSRSIEGENPLYLPQAKVYERSTALGPCLYIPAEPLSKESSISIIINRNSEKIFAQSIQLNRMKRQWGELVEYLYRGCDFEYGCFLMTGTGMVPGNDFTLAAGDEIIISIEHIGTLRNVVAVK